MARRHTTSIPSIIVAVFLVGLAVGLFARVSFWQTPSGGHESTSVPAPPKKDALTCIKSLPDDVKIGQKLMVAAYSDQLGSETPTLTDAKVGGIIVMDAVSAEQLAVFRRDMDITPLIAVDQEGGTVQRYTAKESLPGAEEMASNYSVDEAYDKYRRDNDYLKSIGITTNFSPVVDVISGSSNPLPGRLYSTDPDMVISYASASIRAAKDAGITPVIKHFPGLGSASGNTDYGSATTDPLATLKTRDLLPYRQLAVQHPDVMVANAIVPGLTAGKPAVWSPEAIKLLRSVGYQQTVVYSDSLTARAVPGTLAEAVVKTWQAGVDVALIVQTSEKTPQLDSYLDEIITYAVKTLQSGALDHDKVAASVERILDRKGVDACQLQATWTNDADTQKEDEK